MIGLPNWLNKFRKVIASGGGGGTAYSLIAHTSINNIDSSTSHVTSGIDTTGATVIVVAVSGFIGEGEGAYTTTITDSKGNTWTAAGTIYPNLGSGRQFVKQFYCLNPTVGSGHTFQVTVGSYPNIAVMAFSGGALNTFDTAVGQGYSGSSGSPGSITPVTGELLVSACVNYNNVNITGVSGGYSTITENVASPAQTSLAMSYYIAPSTTAVNPTWANDNGGGAGGVTQLGLK